MIEHWHGDIKVEWTDGEWERLQKIKQGEYVPSVGTATHIISAVVSNELKARIKEYADEKGINVSELLRNVMYILTQ